MKLFRKLDESLKPPYTWRTPPPAATSSQNSTGENLLSNDGFQSRFKKKYIFCGNGCWSNECIKYPDIQLRQRRLTNRCLRCMKEDHKMEDVRWLKRCAFPAEKRTNIIDHLPKEFQLWSNQKTIWQCHDQRWGSIEDSCTWWSYVIKWRNSHAFRGRTCGDTEVMPLDQWHKYEREFIRYSKQRDEQHRIKGLFTLVEWSKMARKRFH